MCCPANLVLAGSSGLRVPKPLTIAWFGVNTVTNKTGEHGNSWGEILF